MPSYIAYTVYFLDTDNETVYSIWNVTQGHAQCHPSLDYLDFLSEIGKWATLIFRQYRWNHLESGYGTIWSYDTVYNVR